MANGITLSYGGQTIRLERFSGGGAQRSYVDSASLNFSGTGSAIQSGNNRAVRRLWVVNTVLEKAEAFAIQNLYVAWDTARATGAVAVVAVTDQITAQNPAAPITASTVFTEPVAMELVGNGSPLYRITFGLTEV